jgi:predicted DNA-binding mobile mystery protein A
MKQYFLTSTQLDNKLKNWRKAKDWFRPKNGWISTIRKALGMTTQQLAIRLQVSRSRIIKIESDESLNALTLQTITTTADALGCDFIYALVPRETLQKTIEKQAEKLAIRQINQVSHNMLLENQRLGTKQNKKHVEALKKKLLEQSPKKLWGTT